MWRLTCLLGFYETLADCSISQWPSRGKAFKSNKSTREQQWWLFERWWMVTATQKWQGMDLQRPKQSQCLSFEESVNRDRIKKTFDSSDNVLCKGEKCIHTYNTHTGWFVFKDKALLQKEENEGSVAQQWEHCVTKKKKKTLYSVSVF